MPNTRRLVAQQWVTLDNIAAEEDGGLSFVLGEPFSDRTDPAFEACLTGLVDAVDTMLLGANTYLQSRDYWPHADDQGEYGEKVNMLTKYVASSTLSDAPWGDFPAATVTRDAVSTVKELKQEPGKDIWLWGSLRLMHSLLAAGVVDVVQLLVCPVTRGRGTRMFESAHELRMIDASGFSNGVSLLRYEIVG